MGIQILDNSSEMAILRRIVDREESTFSQEAARAIIRLSFSPTDLDRMNTLAAKNRDGKLNESETDELNNYIRVGQTLGILQSKARRALPKNERIPVANGTY